MGSNENASKNKRIEAEWKEKENIVICTRTYPAEVWPVLALGQGRCNTESTASAGAGADAGGSESRGDSVGGSLDFAGGDVHALVARVSDMDDLGRTN